MFRGLKAHLQAIDSKITTIMVQYMCTISKTYKKV